MSDPSAGIGRHYLRYSTANILVLLAGLVSFPLLTRLLDNTQYGILGYYETWVLMAVAVAKLGAQHSIQRFYPHGGDEERMHAFATNLFYLPMLGSMVLWAFVGAVAIVQGYATGTGHSPVFWMALVMTPLLVYSSLVETVLRVTEQSRMVMFTRVASRWLQLALMLGAVVAIQHSATAAYGGRLLAVVAGMLFYLAWAHRHLRFARKSVDAAAIRQSFAYGMPLVATEILAVALVSIDRIMLKGLSGDFAIVGIYSVGAALAMQVHMFMNLTVFESFTPTANRVYVTEGAAAVRALKRTMLVPMTYAAIGVALLLWCLGTDLIIALSGSGKAASGPVFELMGAQNAILPVLLVCGFGLVLERRTKTVMLLMCGAVAINALLNWLWIPSYGVMGAAYATLVSSLASSTAACLLVNPALRQFPDGRTLATAFAAAALGIAGEWITIRLQLRPGWQRMLIGGMLIGGPYLLALLALDARLRAFIRPKLKAVEQRLGAGVAG
ncbi:oligosaccharide flippase family protein [Lysobacter sp. LF1]|uniref:Oligosaccharide flippase family protein n=1 Tax=Lysobacter stagni TaxID=3045172 RepID=A0ABT6XJQ5_9GAMM|nr:oligosaccharide flippase family protein [Lysobacter sp. LF1]MDI9240384.1 oligosaccharide flippase family protein [Lysobacter sp. LF1]